MASALDLGIDDVLDVIQNIFLLEGTLRGKEFTIKCPVHEDTNPSCDINIETGFWSCWSCPASGDLVELGHVVLKRPRTTIRNSLKIKDPNAKLQAVRRRLQARRAAERPPEPDHRTWKPSIPPGGSYSPGPLDVLHNRGFTPETLERWGVRYVNRTVLQKDQGTGEFAIEHCFALPAIQDGEVKLWTYGKTEKSHKWGQKYLNTPGVQKQKYWYGWDLIEDYDEVAICEGQLDAMWCDQWGIPALANLGSSLKNEEANFIKIEKLAKFKKVVLFMDRDAAGLLATQNMGALLHRRGIRVTVCKWPSWALGPTGKRAGDPQELDRLDLQIMYWRSESFVRWRLGNQP